jgi:RimJ/RimL family protein N-acetyltransferase
MNSKLLHGDLVRLAAPDPDRDAESLGRWNNDSVFTRFTDGDPVRPLTTARAREQIERDQSEGDNRPVFVIRALADDRLIGYVGLALRWANQDAWVFIGLGERDYWGKGYGTDAMRVILRYAFDELGLQRVSLGLFDHNERALRSYAKAGFVVEGHTRGALQRDGERRGEYFMGILREEWEEQVHSPRS